MQEVQYNIEAEQALLGAILVNNDTLAVLRVPIEANHFYERLHREIFEAISALRKAGRVANTVTVKSYVDDVQVGDMTISQYLARLTREAVNVLNAPDSARAIIETAARRACIALSQKMERTAFSKELNIMDEFEALKASLARAQWRGDNENACRGRAIGSRQHRQGLSGQGGHRHRLRREAPYGHGRPLHAGQLIVIGGATKQGKSSLIEQIVAGAAINGHPVWINSGEMKAEELALRLHRHKKGCGQEAVALARIWSMERASTRVLLWPCSIRGGALPLSRVLPLMAICALFSRGSLNMTVSSAATARQGNSVPPSGWHPIERNIPSNVTGDLIA